MSNEKTISKDTLAERERVLGILNMNPSEIRLMAGEMTSIEMRTVLAVFAGLKHRVLNP